MHNAQEASHIRRDANALVCTVCKNQKDIRRKTTQANLDSWRQKHARCRPVRK